MCISLLGCFFFFLQFPQMRAHFAFVLIWIYLAIYCQIIQFCVCVCCCCWNRSHKTKQKRKDTQMDCVDSEKSEKQTEERKKTANIDNFCLCFRFLVSFDRFVSAINHLFRWDNDNEQFNMTEQLRQILHINFLFVCWSKMKSEHKISKFCLVKRFHNFNTLTNLDTYRQRKFLIGGSIWCDVNRFNW